uniref:Rab-GAP TBC domain-containing protein n=1 Tax=Oryza meridionalis TaxID=40149 RepID=A0A0E0CZ03_9ORYZ
MCWRVAPATNKRTQMDRTVRRRSALLLLALLPDPAVTARAAKPPPPAMGAMGAAAFDFEYKRDAYGFAVRPQHLQRFREYAKIYKEEEEERADRWKDFLDRLAESADDIKASISPSKEDSAVGDVNGGEHLDGPENLENSNRGGIKCNNEEEEGEEDAEKSDTPENSKEIDGNNQSQEANGEADDINDVSANSENLKQESTANSVESDKAPEELKEVSGCSEELLNDENGDSEGLKDSHGVLEGLGEANNDNSEKLEELFLDKGLLDELKPIRVESGKRVRASIRIIEKMMSSRVGKIRNTANDMCGNGEAQLASIEEEERAADKSCRGDPAEESSNPDKVEQAQDREQGDSASAALEGGNGESYFPWREELESLVRGGVPMALRGEMWQAFVGVGARKITGYYNKLLDEGTEELDEKNPEDQELKDQTNAQKKPPEKWKGQIEKDLPRTFPGHPALDEDGRNALRRLLTAYARHNPSVGYCQAMNFFAGLFLLFMPEEHAFWALVGVIDEYFDGYYTEEMIESQVDQLVLEEVVRERFPKLGPALVTTKDAGDAITLLQSLAGSTFDSSQLVLTACMGFQAVREIGLQELRKKHRPDIISAMEERSKDRHSWKDKKGLATKLYSFKHDPLCPQVNSKEGEDGLQVNGEMQFLDSGSANLETYLTSSALDNELEEGIDLQDQVTWLKVELCKLLEEKRSAELRSEELETALMEMVKQDNRHMLSAKVEKLEAEVSELRKSFADKQEQEQAMLQVLIRMEQEQKVAEDARIAAERDAADKKYAAQLLQEKYDAAMAALRQMEKRAVMAETMLEATKQYQAGQFKANQSFNPSSPRAAPQSGKPNQDPNQDAPNRRLGLLSRGLGWLEKSKGKSSSTETPEG